MWQGSLFLSFGRRYLISHLVAPYQVGYLGCSDNDEVEQPLSAPNNDLSYMIREKDIMNKWQWILLMDLKL